MTVVIEAVAVLVVVGGVVVVLFPFWRMAFCRKASILFPGFKPKTIPSPLLRVSIVLFCIYVFQVGMDEKG